MTDQPMIERVARAIAQAALSPYAAISAELKDRIESHWWDYIDEARAAIEAMRDAEE